MILYGVPDLDFIYPTKLSDIRLHMSFYPTPLGGKFLCLYDITEG